MPWLQDPKSAILTASTACCAGKLNPRSIIRAVGMTYAIEGEQGWN
jgi:hypothetical protein